MLRSIGFLTFLALLLVGCGGGSSPPPATYTVGGTVTGLSGQGLVLNSDFGGDLAVSASGSFTFSTRLPVGSSFNIGVKTQPTASPAQHCAVANGTGTMEAANVTNVDVTCVSGFTVGGTVSGLVGTGLTLALCVVPQHGGIGYGTCRAQLLIRADGTFTMDDVFPANYSGGTFVSIAQQPTSPSQHCLISNAKVSVQNANDTSVTVSCATFLYVTNAADNTVSAYTVYPGTGALAAINTPTVAGVSPYALVSLMDYSNNRYVFVGNEGSDDISAFAVDNATGALTAVPGSPFPAGTDPQAMVLSFLGSFILYVANAGSDDVSAYVIDENTGALTAQPGFPLAVGKNPTSIVVNGNNVVYVANHGGSNNISAFHPDLTPVTGSPFPVGGNPLSLAIGASGAFLYSANPDVTAPSIAGFSIDPATGALSPLSGSPFPLPVSHYIATDQMGSYLYVTSGANIVGYAINASSGALTPLPGFPVAAGADAYSISVDSTNQFLYVANESAANIAGFRLNASTGALTPIPGAAAPAGHQPHFVAMF